MSIVKEDSIRHITRRSSAYDDVRVPGDGQDDVKEMGPRSPKELVTDHPIKELKSPKSLEPASPSEEEFEGLSSCSDSSQSCNHGNSSTLRDRNDAAATQAMTPSSQV